MDILNNVFDTLGFSGTLYFRTEFSGRWAVTVPQYRNAARFHMLLRGKCCVQIEDQEIVELEPGDLVLIARGASHILSDTPRVSAPPLEKIMQESGYNGNGVLVFGNRSTSGRTQMLCGHFSFRQLADHPVLQALPAALQVKHAERKAFPLLDQLVGMLADRAFCDNFAADAAITRLSEIVFMELIRSGIARNRKLCDLVTAMREPKIARALQLIHWRPEYPWTLDKLACETAMSRSRFADKFKAVMGVTPMTYLADWRLQTSLKLLADPSRSIQQVAEKSGYHSNSGFTRAFHEKFGIAPTAYRLQNAFP